MGHHSYATAGLNAGTGLVFVDHHDLRFCACRPHIAAGMQQSASSYRGIFSLSRFTVLDIRLISAMHLKHLPISSLALFCALFAIWITPVCSQASSDLALLASFPTCAVSRLLCSPPLPQRRLTVDRRSASSRLCPQRGAASPTLIVCALIRPLETNLLLVSLPDAHRKIP